MLQVSKCLPRGQGLARALVGLGRDPALLARMRAYNESHEPEQTWPHVVARAQGFYRQASAAGGSA